MNQNVEWLRSLAARGGKGGVNNIDARALGRIANDLDRMRAALENARRDLLGACPKSAAGGRRKIIKDAVARIEAVLNPSPQSGEGQ